MPPPPELPRALHDKLLLIEKESLGAKGFTSSDWFLLALTGAILPALLLWWGAL